jgi:hypothetical protein
MLFLINFYGWYLNSGSMGHAKPRTFLHLLAGCVTEQALLLFSATDFADDAFNKSW